MLCRAALFVCCLVGPRGGFLDIIVEGFLDNALAQDQAPKFRLRDVGLTARGPAPGSSPCNETGLVRGFRVGSDGSASVALPAPGRWYVCQRRSKGLSSPFSTADRRGDAAPAEIAVVSGMRPASAEARSANDMALIVPVDESIKILLLGSGFTVRTRVVVTIEARGRGAPCPEHFTEPMSVQPLQAGLAAEVIMLFPSAASGRRCFLCVLSGESSEHIGRTWVHQGSDPLVSLDPEAGMFPLWVHLLLIALLLALSGLFSGLTLGLMALDQTELQVIASCGTEEEKSCARKILPLRKRGNYLLCSLVLGNVCVNSTVTILLDEMTSGLLAVLMSTMGIVIFGEIFPQAVCSRYGLAIGARTIVITKMFMLLTFPLSWPISKLLDYFLGEEIGAVFDRDKLAQYLKITKDYAQLEHEELNIIFGALELTKKTAKDIMTRIDDVYMVPYDAVLDFETMSDIVKRGYTRVPVFEGSKQNIVSLMNTKDLAFVDPDDAIPLRTLCHFYNHPLSFVREDETLDALLREFKKGHSHMAFVRPAATAAVSEAPSDVSNAAGPKVPAQGAAAPSAPDASGAPKGPGAPLAQGPSAPQGAPPSATPGTLTPTMGGNSGAVVGLVTLEDVIEEIIQSEIIDETDVLMDNRRKQRRKGAQGLQDFSDFVKIGGGQQGKNVVTAQLAFATFQFLSTAVRPFTAEFISAAVLRRLLAQSIFFTVKPGTQPVQPIFEAGKPVNYFVIILEGHVRVSVGREALVFEAGPFAYFGLPSLTPGREASFIPDYSVIPISYVVYLKVNHGMYVAALRASRLVSKPTDQTDDQVTDRMLLESLEEYQALQEQPAVTTTNQKTVPAGVEGRTEGQAAKNVICSESTA